MSGDEFLVLADADQEDIDYVIVPVNGSGVMAQAQADLGLTVQVGTEANPVSDGFVVNWGLRNSVPYVFSAGISGDVGDIFEFSVYGPSGQVASKIYSSDNLSFGHLAYTPDLAGTYRFQVTRRVSGNDQRSWVASPVSLMRYPGMDGASDSGVVTIDDSRNQGMFPDSTTATIEATAA